MIRYLFRCQNGACRHIWALDYQERPNGQKPTRPFPSAAGITTPEFDKIRGCLKCRSTKRPIMARVRGIYSPAVSCDARCTDAVGAACTCSCAGLNHGKKHIHQEENAK